MAPVGLTNLQREGQCEAQHSKDSSVTLRRQYGPVQGRLYRACDYCSNSTGLQRLHCSCRTLLL